MVGVHLDYSPTVVGISPTTVGIEVRLHHA